MDTQDSPPQRPLSAALVGTWELLSREDRTASGERRDEPSLGSDPVALLYFDGTGHFAAQFMKRDRGGPAAPEAPASAANNSRARGGYDAYFGAYSVDEAGGTVTTRLVGALSPENVGQVYVRVMGVAGDALTIRLETTSGAGEPVIRTLRWRRVGDATGGIRAAGPRAGAVPRGPGPVGITVRGIREEDAPAFREVLDAVCRERRHLAMLEAPAADEVRSFVASNLRSGCPQLVAEEAGRIVGWCDIRGGPAAFGRAHVGQLGMGVLAGHRGRGIGRLLLQATVERARELGLEKVELEVFASNAPAIGLYRSFGFLEEGRRRRGRLVDGAYDDVLLMGLGLARPDGPPPRA